MGWIEDNKGAGPAGFNFTKQFAKYSYNEGDHIATSENPIWNMEEGSNIPITPVHKPCGYWFNEPYIPPPPPGFCNNPILTRLGDITLAAGENTARAASIDSSGSYAYFGLGTDPAKIVKVKLSDFTKEAVLTLNSGESGVQSMSISTDDAYLYVGTTASPIDIVKVRLSDFTRQGAISWTIERGVWVGSPSLVVSSSRLYFGTTGTFDLILRVTIPALGFTPLDDSLSTGEISTDLRAGVIDNVNGYAYWGTGTRSPAKIWRLNLTTFMADSLTLNTGENNVGSGVIDTTNGYAYFGTNQIHYPPLPAKIIKIRLSDFTRVGAITLMPGEEELEGDAAIDTINQLAYFIASEAEGKIVVVTIDLNNFARLSALTLNAGETKHGVSVIDVINGLLYVGTGGVPTKIVKIGLCGD